MTSARLLIIALPIVLLGCGSEEPNKPTAAKSDKPTEETIGIFCEDMSTVASMESRNSNSEDYARRALRRTGVEPTESYISALEVAVALANIAVAGEGISRAFGSGYGGSSQSIFEKNCRASARQQIDQIEMDRSLEAAMEQVSKYKAERERELQSMDKAALITSYCTSIRMFSELVAEFKVDLAILNKDTFTAPDAEQSARVLKENHGYTVTEKDCSQ